MATTIPTAACSRRTATRLLLGTSFAGLATGVASAGTDDGPSTLAFHCPFGTPVDYAFEASGDVTVLDHAPNLDVPDDHVSADRGSAVDGGAATGTVNGGYDVFAYEGDLVAFEITGGDCADLELWDTGEPVDACELAAQLADGDGTAGRDPEVVTSCRTIDEPGYYVLGDDVDGTGHDGSGGDGGRDVCIEITADDVIFDGLGHALLGGPAGHDVGVRVSGDGVVVRDLEAIDWGIGVHLLGDHSVLHRATIERRNQPGRDREAGLRVEGAAATVRDIEVVAGPVGAHLLSATDTVLADSGITGLIYGIVLEEASGCVLRNDGGGSTGSEGLVLADSHDNLLAGNEFGAPSIGVSVGGSHRNVFRENSFSSSVDHALAISNCEDLVLLDNDASGGQSGIYLQDVTDSVFRGNSASETERTGVQLRGGSGNVFAQNETNRNQEAGIELTETTENVLFGNAVRENSGRDNEGGILLVDADRNTVVRNTVCDNAGPSQIVVEGSSSGNRIADNDTTC